MTAIADHLERGETRTPMLLGRFRTWLVMVAVKAKVPETNGKSLEEIQEVWAEHDERRSAPQAPTLHVDLA